MFKAYINLAYRHLQWYRDYYLIITEDFIPSFRYYFETLVIIKQPISTYLLQNYLQYLFKVLITLWNYEMYAIKLSYFIQDFSKYVDNINRYYNLLFHN